jgi:two-component system, OmpR family, KDP operon response regulator KdpE
MMAAADGPSRADTGPYVLVVENDPAIRGAIQRVLEAEGLAVETAVDGWQALARVLRRRPSLVVLDLALPRLDGEDVAAALRMIHQPEIPILAIGGRVEAAERARQVGVFGYLEKPFDTAAMLAAVRSALDRPPAVGPDGPDRR